MTKLTTQQELFAQEYAKCGNATQSYKKAYPKSLKWKESSVWRKASEAINNVKVSARVNEIKQELAKLNLWEKSDMIRVLKEIANESFVNNSERIQAIKQGSTMLGYDKQAEVNSEADNNSRITIITNANRD